MVVISGGRLSERPLAMSGHSTAKSVQLNIKVQTTVTTVKEDTRITRILSSEA